VGSGQISCVRRGVSISKKCKRRIKWTGEEFTLMANPKPHINLEPRTEPPSHINLQLKPTRTEPKLQTELKLQTEPKPQVKFFLFCSKGSQDNPCSLMKNGTKKRKPKGLTPFDPDTIRVQRYYCRTHQRFFTEIPSSLLPRVHYTAPVVTFSLDYFIFPNYLKYRRTKHLSRGRAWRKEPKIHSTSKLRDQIMKNEELKEDLLNRLAKQRAVQAERGEEWQNDLQGQLERQNSQVLEGQSKLERQKEQLPSLPHQRTIRRWIRVLSAGWDHLHKTVARYFDKWWNLFWYRMRSGVFDLFSLQSFLNGLSWEEKRRGSPYYYAFVRSP
jgi:hypothetical protein